MTEQKTAIEVRGLSKLFGNRMALCNVDLDVAAGESVALIGANGAGKTTLLRCLASAIRPTAGEVRWFGQMAGKDPSSRHLIGVLGHDGFLYPQLTLRENLLFAARMCDVRRPADRAAQLLDEVRLGPYAHCYPTQISRGMRQRVALARAMVHDPPILLLDEPFSGLDSDAADWLSDLLVQLHDRGRTVCFATHDRPKAQRLADRVLQLQSGRLMASDSVSKRIPRAA